MKCLTLPETGTLWFPGSPRKHQIGPPGTKNPLQKHMIQGIPPNNDVIDPFTFRHFLGKNWMSQGFPKILKCYCPLHFFQTILRIGTSRFWHFRVKPEVPSAQFWNRKFKKKYHHMTFQQNIEQLWSIYICFLDTPNRLKMHGTINLPLDINLAAV